MNLHCICYLKWRESILRIEEKKNWNNSNRKKTSWSKKKFKKNGNWKKYGQKWVWKRSRGNSKYSIDGKTITKFVFNRIWQCLYVIAQYFRSSFLCARCYYIMRFFFSSHWSAFFYSSHVFIHGERFDSGHLWIWALVVNSLWVLLYCCDSAVYCDEMCFTVRTTNKIWMDKIQHRISSFNTQMESDL